MLQQDTHLLPCRKGSPGLSLRIQQDKCDAGVFQKFHDSVWGKKLSRRKAKEGLTDFDRFKASRAHAKKGAAVRSKLDSLKQKS